MSDQIRTYRLVVRPRPAEPDIQGRQLVERAHQLGVTRLARCLTARLFFVQGSLTRDDAEAIALAILCDPVTETLTVKPVSTEAEPGQTGLVDVTLLPGVTDPPAENLLRSAHELGWPGLQRAATGQRYQLAGPDLTQADLAYLTQTVLSNPVIQRAGINQPLSPPFFAYQAADDTVETIPLREATTSELVAISQERRLALDETEMLAIQAYFQAQKRDPSDAELEMLAQTWSEHCVHKTFKAHITYTGPRPGADPAAAPEIQVIDNLLKTYLQAATDQLHKNWVRSAFVDNAGIVAFDDQFDLAFKVETHNHPSALEPFGGANTGVGGVVRDVLGVSARPIANTDVLCFGPLTLSENDLPQGVLHPRRVAAGVIHGIEDYGNKMGIPTVNGAIVYQPGYTANPLVYCGCLGILPHGSHRTGAQANDLIVVIGGRTGRDGLRGATFSSMEMDVDTSDIAGTAVQIGHPINEKQIQEVVLRARDEGLYHAITDCGAGGLSSAVGEMGEAVGASVKLETVPLKYPGLRPWEIWLSEAQERMVLAVPEENWPRLQEICAGQDVEAVSIGHFEATSTLRLSYHDVFVGEIEMAFLHDGIPQRRLEAVWTPPAGLSAPEEDLTVETTPMRDHTPVLLQLMAHPNIASKEDTVRRYDHEVQAGGAVKPLVGVANHGPGDAAVLVPLDTQVPTQATQPIRGAALSNGINPHYGLLDPYAMAWSVVDEAVRNLVAVGADPDQISILDNFCWGNPKLPDRLGSLVRCAQGCYDAALAYGTPFISGKDSLNNEYTGADGDKHAIPGTLLISALGIVPDVHQTVTMDFKQAGNLIYIVGDTAAELGGSHYAQLSEAAGPVPGGQRPPQPQPEALAHYRALHRAVRNQLVQSCHDCSEGGLAVALAEMCLAGRLGAGIELDQLPGAAALPHDAALLFSESAARLLVEVRPQDAQAFEQVMRGVPFSRIGHVRLAPQLRVIGIGGEVVVDAEVAALEAAWRGQVAPAQNYQPPRSGLTSDVQAIPVVHTRSPQVLILHANGTNRDRDAELACSMAGGQPEIVHLNQLLQGERQLLDYHMLLVPGGFSYGDDLGAGKLWALDLRHRLGTDLARFIEQGRPVLGICNGFQVLVKSGLLPGDEWTEQVTLTYNASGRFECRWVYLQPNLQSPSFFVQGMTEPVYCPVAHGEGRVAVTDETVLQALQAANLHALTYVNPDGGSADYPANPNGSVAGIAGLSNAAGNVFGLMPHPEDHIFNWQHPRYQRGERGLLGLRLFENGLRHA